MCIGLCFIGMCGDLVGVELIEGCFVYLFCIWNCWFVMSWCFFMVMYYLLVVVGCCWLG